MVVTIGIILAVAAAVYFFFLHKGAIKDTDKDFIPDRVEDAIDEVKDRADDVADKIVEAIDAAKGKKDGN